MFLAILPFVAEGVASDWPSAVACLERTLGSIFANPQTDLRAMVVCQDRPTLKINDSRYIFLATKWPKPDKNDIMAKHQDKGHKLTEAIQQARGLAPEYIMFVDADDLISNTLVSYVKARPEFDAFCMKVGYEWKQGSSSFMLKSRFNQICATAYVWRFNARCFPGWLGASQQLVGELGHNEVEAAMDSAGLRVHKMRVPKAVYVTGHGNHMDAALHQLSVRRLAKDWARSFWQKRILTAALRNEFGLTDSLEK